MIVNPCHERAEIAETRNSHLPPDNAINRVVDSVDTLKDALFDQNLARDRIHQRGKLRAHRRITLSRNQLQRGVRTEQATNKA